MADRLQQIDLTQFRAFADGDEQALIHVYRTRYESLLEQAQHALGSDLAHFRARVAQQSMLSVWNHRTHVGTVEEMDSALAEAITAEAALQRRKHAALHHGTREGSAATHTAIPSTDEAVERLRESLHAKTVDHAQVVIDTMSARKHHAAESLQSVASRGGWQKPAAFLAVAGVAIVLIMRWIDANSSEVAATQALAAENARSVSSARGQRGTVSLNDGSTARLGSESEIKTPAEFGGLVRTLELKDGTAMFTVAPANERPFEVRAKNVVVSATGTVFTVRAFDEDSAVYVGVEEGSVMVRARDVRGETALSAGKALRIASDGSVTSIDDAARQETLGWVRDTLVFTNTPVKRVLPALIRWLDLKASLGDPALGERTVSMRVPLESSGEALRILAEAAQLSIGFDQEDKVVLGDVGARGSAASKKPR